MRALGLLLALLAGCGPDGDGDGHRGDDCDDGVAAAFPGAPEVCDGAPNGCQDASSWSSTSETGAWFVELTADPTSPDPRRYTDLAPILSMNGTFITPATGVVWLCDDQRWTGLLSASEPLRITSPEGQRAQFGREAAPGTLISGDLEVLGIDLVVELQAFGGVRLEDVSLQGTLNHGLGGFAATDTTFAPNPGGGALYSVGGTLSLDGPLTFQGVTATNFPIRIDAARRTVDIVDSTFTDSAQAFALDVSRPDQVTLTTDTFRDVVGAIRVTTSGTLGATDVQFVRAGTNVSWLGQPYALGDGTFDFSCAGRVCTTP